MATFVSELEAAKKNLSEALGDNVKQYWANLKLWFKQKISKEEFDLEAHRLLTQDNVHSHNDFLLAILTRCQILVSTPEGAGSLPWTGGSAAKPGKPKGKKKLSSVRQKFDHRFQPQNPLSGAQQFVAKDPQDDDDLKLCSHTMMLPTRGQLEGRMIVTAYEHGLDNVTEEAVSAVVYAVENHLKDILTSVVSRRKAYRLRDGHFKYAFGSNVTPQPYLKNSVVAYNNLIESSWLCFQSSSLLCSVCWSEPSFSPAPRRRGAASCTPAGLLGGHSPRIGASSQHVRPVRSFAGTQGSHSYTYCICSQH
ncbi:transcriptional adapter 1 isoform X2 [Neomonachus schauinslandi]|uniref:Transcriptional adapter 1 n=1 Tax=Neomonachus schauinslandi TaxID=29088 RepID=A0A2Y9GHA8_NEOSC|nr:transcriptional adapter 1 isoform X2 [Neomonachus schauinslandi]